MGNKPFYYDNKDQALFDLKLFSNMNANENKVLYLKKGDPGYWIDHDAVHGDDIEAIALNGVVFLPSSN